MAHRTKKSEASKNEASYESNIRFHGAYKFEDKDIEKIVQIAKEFLGFEKKRELSRDRTRITEIKEEISPKITVALENDHNISTKEISQIFSDTLIQTKKIMNISISGDNYDPRPRRSISVSIGTRYLTPINVDVGGGRDESQLVRGKLEDIIRSKKQWYSFLVLEGRIFAAAIAISLVYAVVFLALAILHWIVLSKDWYEKIAAFILFEAGLATWVIISIKKFLFPTLIFNIGLSGQIARKIEIWRERIIWIFGVSLIVGIISSLVASRLDRWIT